MRQAGQKALDNSPTYIAAKSSYELAKLQTQNNRAIFYPSLDLLALHGPQNYHPNPALYPEWTSSTQLIFSESLYDNGESYKHYQIAKLSEEQSQVQFQKAKGQVLLGVVQSYYDWCFSELQLQFTKKYADEIERQFQLASAEFHQGAKTRADFLRFKSQAQRSELDLIDAQKLAVKAAQDLMALIGVSPDSSVQFALLQRPASIHKKIRSDFTEKDLPEEKILQIKYGISDLEEALVNRRNWPQALITASWQYGSQNYIQTGQSWNDNEGSSWNALLTLKWNLWDWGTRARNEQIQTLQENMDQQDLRKQLLSAEDDLSHFKIDQARNIERQKISTELETNEQINMKQLNSDYHAGRINYLDLITGLANLLDAQSRKLRADFDAGILFAKSQYYEGTLDENSLEE